MLSLLGEAFILGVLTPLTAICVLPLFPGFLAFLSNQTSLKGKYAAAIFGTVVAVGVVAFMFVFGLVFSYFLEVSLTAVIGIITPIAMGILLIISILLIFDVDFARFLPHFATPESKNPFLNAFLFGFFFAAVVIPCQPGFLAAFFARSLVEFSGFIPSMMKFLAFGIGMAFPLLLFSVFSLRWSTQIIRYLTKHKTIINRTTGAVMLVLVSYFLIVDFKIHERLF